MSKAIEALKAARAEAVREFDEAIVALGSSPKAKAAEATTADKPKRTISEETRAKMKAAHAARRARLASSSADEAAAE